MISLTWADKRAPTPPSPAIVTRRETFAPQPVASGPPSAAERDGGREAECTGDFYNAIYHGDNLGVLAALLDAGWGGRFRLVYADPPYNSGAAWARKVRRRGPQVSSANAVVDQQHQYADTWDESTYLQFLYERLPLLRNLLAPDGSLWLHCDHRHSHHLRCLLEEVFGTRNYLNTITWRSQTARGAKVNAFYFANSAHAIHVFAKDRGAPTRWTPAKKTLILSAAQAAAEYMRDERGFFRTSDPGTFSYESLARLHAEGRLYAPYGGEIRFEPQARRVACSNGGNIGVKYYLGELGDGRYTVERGVDNIWDDIPGLGTTPGEDLGYPTQKTEALLNRILTTATEPGDWVLDPFMGSGTTPTVAQKLGRRWVGCDASLGAVQTTRRRLYAVIHAQLAAGADTSTHADAVLAANTAPVREFVLYAGASPASPPAPLFQVDLTITPIDAEEARIRVTVAGATWPQQPALALDDWRAAVDCIAIDPNFDGCTLRVALADAPRKRTEWVAGMYELPIAAPDVCVAVRITDIWGQEVLLVRNLGARNLSAQD